MTQAAASPAFKASVSLRVRLAAWLLLPLSLFVIVCAVLSWRQCAAVADYLQDRELLASAKVLADRLIWEDDSVHASVPPSALSLFASAQRDQVFLSVRTLQGSVLAGTPDFPAPPQLRLQGDDAAQWYDLEFKGLHLRAIATQRPMYDAGETRDILIFVGKTTRSRDHMQRRLWLPSLAYLLVALLLAVVLTVVALTWELRPLTWLNRHLAAHDPLHPEDFAVDARALHTELRPVADTVNRFARQLRAHAQAQRRFIADAAHQLRTPLALQASQIEFARYTRAHRGEWATRRADMDAMWLALQVSNRQLIAVTNQLLLLAQAERDDAVEAFETVDLGAAALRCVEQLAALAERRHIDLGMEGLAEAGVLPVRAHPALLDALLSNLLDNALRYTPEGGRVTVGLQRLGAQAEFRVDDNGPGIPAEARERVFERFHRLASDTEGSGLGLAIVREIARGMGVEVVLESNPREATGLRAIARFPLMV